MVIKVTEETINYSIALIMAVIGGTITGYVLAQIMFHTVVRLMNMFCK